MQIKTFFSLPVNDDDDVCVETAKFILEELFFFSLSLFHEFLFLYLGSAESRSRPPTYHLNFSTPSLLPTYNKLLLSRVASSRKKNWSSEQYLFRGKKVTWTKHMLMLTQTVFKGLEKNIYTLNIDSPCYKSEDMN